MSTRSGGITDRRIERMIQLVMLCVSPRSRFIAAISLSPGTAAISPTRASLRTSAVSTVCLGLGTQTLLRHWNCFRRTRPMSS